MPTWVEGGQGPNAPSVLDRVVSKARQMLTKRVSRGPSDDLLELSQRVAADVGLPVGLLRSVVWLESKWDAKAVSVSGAKGLGQITMSALDDVRRLFPRALPAGRLDLFDPLTNLAVTARYIVACARYLGLDVYDSGSWADIYVAYNIGPTGARYVLAGNPERASRFIAYQAYGEPEVYYVNLVAAFARAVKAST